MRACTGLLLSIGGTKFFDDHFRGMTGGVELLWFKRDRADEIGRAHV